MEITDISQSPDMLEGFFEILDLDKNFSVILRLIRHNPVFSTQNTRVIMNTTLMVHEKVIIQAGKAIHSSLAFRKEF